MGLFDRLKRLLRLQSIDNQSIHPSQQPIQDTLMGMEPEKPQSTSPVPIPVAVAPEPSPPEPIEIERDSLQLGIAAGYTGRSIRDIDSALNRIETQMVTKDWLEIKLREHEDKEGLRFNKIETAISPLLRLIQGIPPAQALQHVIEGIRLTRRMGELLKVVEEAKEISYSGLALKLGIQQDNLRGLLSKIARRTSKIQRFERDNNGWVRWISDFSQQSIDKSQDASNQIPENTQEG